VEIAGRPDATHGHRRLMLGMEINPSFLGCLRSRPWVSSCWATTGAVGTASARRTADMRRTATTWC